MSKNMNFNVEKNKDGEKISVQSDDGEVELTVKGDVDVDEAFQYMPQAYKRTKKIGKKNK